MDPEDWSVDANEALEICLYNPKTGKQVASNIHPSFTYTIFGEKETIFGYKDLKIRLMFATDDMTPCVEVTYGEKVPKVGDVEAEDVVEIMGDYLPKQAFTQDPAAFLKSLKERTETFTPPGEFVSSYKQRGHTFSIYKAVLTSPECSALLERMQVLIPLYIEGGNMLDLDDEEWTLGRWTVFFLYDTTLVDLPSFIGYCTLYDHYYFDKSNAGLARTRLSQFLILPPYQKHGNGTNFYNAIVAHYINSRPDVKELTVEDPNEPFTDMRDLADMARLRKDPEIAKMTLASVVGQPRVFPWEEVRKRQKMPSRQFSRCIEMLLLNVLSRSDTKNVKAYRLFVKERIYKQNSDVLAQVDRPERVDKLTETYYHVEDDYQRLLKTLRTRRVVEEKEDGGEGKSERPKKRVRVDSNP